MTAAGDPFPEVLPHDPLIRVFDDVGFVRGTIRLGPGMTMTRAMTVVRHPDGSSVVFNAVRLAPDAELFEFEQARAAGKPEAMVLLHRHRGVLVSCDALQNLTSWSRCSWLATWVLWGMGFGRAGQVGPGWRRAVETAPGALRADLERVLALRFRHLLPGHGLPLMDTAHQEVEAALRETWG